MLYPNQYVFSITQQHFIMKLLWSKYELKRQSLYCLNASG